MTDAVIDGRVGCSNQKMVELRTQRKTELWDIRLWAVLEAARQNSWGKLTKGRSTQESWFFFLRKTYLKVRNKSSHCGGTLGNSAEASEFKRKMGGSRRWKQGPAKRCM